MGLTRCWQSTEGLHPPYPPINWRLLEEYGICTEEKKNFLCRTVVIICFSGQFGLRCEGFGNNKKSDRTGTQPDGAFHTDDYLCIYLD